MRNNKITGMLKIDPTQLEPYRLVFEYEGDEGLKERILNVSQSSGDYLYLKSKPCYKGRGGLFYLPSLVIGESSVTFLEREKAEEALIDINSLVNIYLKSIQEDYEKLLVEKQTIDYQCTR